MHWAIAFNICTPLLRNSGIRQGKGKKFVDFLWGKARNTGIPKGNEQKKLEFFRCKIWKLHEILEGLAHF